VVDNNSPALPVFELKQNHPNPFNPSTTISFSLNNDRSAIDLCIYNLKGQLVKKLFSGSLDKGNHSYVWDGNDDAGRSASSGVYLYRLNSGTTTQQRKMVLMK